jgi:hypothetical protein
VRGASAVVSVLAVALGRVITGSSEIRCDWPDDGAFSQPTSPRFDDNTRARYAILAMSSPPDHDPDGRPPVERLIPELLKRVIESGTKNLSAETIRQLVGELKLPKDALHYTFNQLDETKNGVYRIIGKEVRDLLERTNLGDEIANALSMLALEIKMEVRFKPSKESTSSKGSPLDASIRVKRSSAPAGEDDPKE